SLIDDVRELRAGITGRATRDHCEIDAFGQLHFLRVHAQNFFASCQSWQIDSDLAIETARSQQGGVEHIRAVRGGDNDHAFLRIEAVHLHEQRIQGLLALVVAATYAMATMTPDSVNFVDEDDARRGFFALLKHVAHTTRADAHEHFNKVRAAD